MTGTFQLEIVVPERLLLNEEVEETQVPAKDGSLGVLPRHAPLFTELGAGVLSCRTGARTRYMALDGGIMEVRPDQVRVLADTAEWSDDVDVERAEQARVRANELLRKGDLTVDVERALRAVRRAEARIEAHRRAQQS